jgi:hypothetical protein
MTLPRPRPKAKRLANPKAKSLVGHQSEPRVSGVYKLTLDSVFERLRGDHLDNRPVDKKSNSRLIKFICQIENRAEFKRRFDKENDPDFKKYIVERCNLRVESVQKTLGLNEALIEGYSNWERPLFAAGVSTIGVGAVLMGKAVAAAGTAAAVAASAPAASVAGTGTALVSTAAVAKATFAAGLYFGADIALAGGVLTILGLAAAGFKILAKNDKIELDNKLKHTSELTLSLKNSNS